jgi:hypothetical protein
VIVWEKTSESLRGPTRVANLDEWRRRNHTFVQLAGVIPSVGSMVLAHADGTTDTIARPWATGGFFDVLGVPAVAGHLFTEADDTAGRNIVVLSEALWERPGRHAVNRREFPRDSRLPSSIRPG